MDVRKLIFENEKDIRIIIIQTKVLLAHIHEDKATKQLHMNLESLLIGQWFSNSGIQYMAFKLCRNHGNITCTVLYIFIDNTIINSIMAHDSAIVYF